MKIHQISNATFLRPGMGVATVMSVAAICFNQRIFMSKQIKKIIVLNGFVSFLFYFTDNT